MEHKAHNQFLKNLKEILPENCKPIIITDAGFYNPWFKKITENGWDYIGRVRGLKTFYQKGQTVFFSISTLFNKTLKTPKCLGEIELCKANSMKTVLYGYKRKSKKRKAHRKTNKNGSNRLGIACSKAVKEPWLLVSSTL